MIHRRISPGCLAILGLWVVLSLTLSSIPAGAVSYYFDMDSNVVIGGTTSGAILTESGYQSVLNTTLYGSGNTWGWNESPTGRVRPDMPQSSENYNLLRDFHFYDQPRTFSVDLPEGESFTVTLYFYDYNYDHDTIQVFVDDSQTPAVDIVDLPQQKLVTATFTIVSDGKLDLMFKDYGGSDPNWVVNAIAIVPNPSTCLLLGTGLLGLMTLGWRRRRK